MIRYLRMDLRRLFKTRGFYLSILLSLVFLLILSIAAYFVTGLAQEMTGQEFSGPMNNPMIITQARSQMNVGFFASFFLSHNSLLHLLLALFAAGFIAKDHQSGYLKNLFCLPGLRFRWFFAKLIVLLIAALIYYAVYLLGCLLVVLIYGNPLSLNWADLARYFGLHLSVDMALFALICLITSLLQTKSAAVILALVLSLNIQGIFYLLIDSIGFLPFKLGEYGMMRLASRLITQGSITSFIGASQGTTAQQLLPVSLGLLLIASAACLYSLHRVDYRG